MAGAGRRIFQPGEILTASNTMNYLMDQAVQVYAGTAARGSAIGTAVSEGMVSYLADTNSMEFYTGSAWDSLNPSGRILQTVSTTKTDTYSFSAASGFTSITDLTATITPRFNTSKILVLLNIGVLGVNQANEVIQFNLRRNSSDIAKSTGVTNNTTGVSAYNVANLVNSYSLNYRDSPATTSALTYDVAIAVTGGTGYINRWPINGDRGGVSTITLLEVAA